MASQEELLPLIGNHGFDRPGQKKMKRVSSIAQELGPEATQKGKASVVNVGINLAKTAGKIKINKQRVDG